MKRPTLDKNISTADFRDFYWLKQELVGFCKKYGISVNGSKIDLAERIHVFLDTGHIPAPLKQGPKSESKFDWSNERLLLSTIITDSYRNTENVRQFFIDNIGSHFSFNVKFMDWMKQNIGKQLSHAIEEWNRIYEQKKDKSYKTDIAPQFEYNRYMRAFLADNPNLAAKDAIKFWKLKRAIRGSNKYERTDLDLK